jgi:hypothetical protein
VTDIATENPIQSRIYPVSDEIDIESLITHRKLGDVKVLQGLPSHEIETHLDHVVMSQSSALLNCQHYQHDPEV